MILSLFLFYATTAAATINVNHVEDVKPSAGYKQGLIENSLEFVYYWIAKMPLDTVKHVFVIVLERIRRDEPEFMQTSHDEHLHYLASGRIRLSLSSDHQAIHSFLKHLCDGERAMVIGAAARLLEDPAFITDSCREHILTHDPDALKPCTLDRFIGNYSDGERQAFKKCLWNEYEKLEGCHDSNFTSIQIGYYNAFRRFYHDLATDVNGVTITFLAVFAGVGSFFVAYLPHVVFTFFFLFMALGALGTLLYDVCLGPQARIRTLRWYLQAELAADGFMLTQLEKAHLNELIARGDAMKKRLDDIRKRIAEFRAVDEGTGGKCGCGIPLKKENQ